MEILEDFVSLRGKTIAFSWFPQFGDTVVLATTDNGVFIAQHIMEYDDDLDGHSQIKILRKGAAMRFLESDQGRYVRKELTVLDIFDLESFKQREQERFEKEAAERKKRKEEEDYTLYLKLKERYEGYKHDTETNDASKS